MISLKLFHRHECPQCPVAIQVAGQLEKGGLTVRCYDQDEALGRAEGAFHQVMSTPTLILVDDADRELAEWRGTVPTVEQVMTAYQEARNF